MNDLFDSSNESPRLTASELKKLAHADPLKLKPIRESFYKIRNPESFCTSDAVTTLAADSPLPVSPSHPIYDEWEDIAVRLSGSSSTSELLQFLEYTKQYLRSLVGQRGKSSRQAMAPEENELVVKHVGAKFCDIISTHQQRGVHWNHELELASWSIRKEFFDFNHLRKLPLEVIQEIFLWLPANTFGNLACVCSQWNRLCLSDEVWSELYTRKFLVSNPGPLPDRGTESMYNAFHARLKDPSLGDKVEVAWKGKFRLETNDVYQGLAWWRAEIVDKHTAQKRYKIHYPGWESRWDEWVPSSRLRWMAERNDKEAVHVGDVVEVWCCGVNVPGAWLETKVKKIKSGMYCLGKVMSSGNLWVERNRLRLVRRAPEETLEIECATPATPATAAIDAFSPVPTIPMAHSPATPSPAEGLFASITARVEQLLYGSPM